MSWKVIFEERYQPIENPVWGDDPDDFIKLAKDIADFKERLLQISRELEFISEKERIAQAETFLQRAILDAFLYRFDIRVEKKDACIRVTYSFDENRERCELQELFSMAHRFSFFKNLYDREYSIVLQYYTCDAVYHGKVVCP